MATSSELHNKRIKLQEAFEHIMHASARLFDAGGSKPLIELTLNLANEIDINIIQVRREYGRALIRESDAKESGSKDSDGAKDNSIPALEDGMENPIHSFGNLSTGARPGLLDELRIRVTNSIREKKE